MNTISFIDQYFGYPNTMTTDSCVRAIHSIPFAERKDVVFMISPETHRSIRKLKDGAAHYLWHWGTVSGDTVPMFLGHPVEENEYIPYGEVRLSRSVKVDKSRCSHCGTKIPSDRVNCIACGAPY